MTPSWTRFGTRTRIYKLLNVSAPGPSDCQNGWGNTVSLSIIVHISLALTLISAAVFMMTMQLIRSVKADSYHSTVLRITHSLLVLVSDVSCSHPVPWTVKIQLEVRKLVPVMYLHYNCQCFSC
jgi:hypothetical protein